LPSTGVSDRIHDAVTVNADAHCDVHEQHWTGVLGWFEWCTATLAAETCWRGDGGVSTILLPAINSQVGFTSVQYYDANNNGVLDATDPVVSGGSWCAVTWQTSHHGTTR
jgi:hypothetical protein